MVVRSKLDSAMIFIAALIIGAVIMICLSGSLHREPPPKEKYGSQETRL